MNLQTMMEEQREAAGAKAEQDEAAGEKAMELYAGPGFEPTTGLGASAAACGHKSNAALLRSLLASKAVTKAFHFFMPSRLSGMYCQRS